MWHSRVLWISFGCIDPSLVWWVKINNTWLTLVNMTGKTVMFLLQRFMEFEGSQTPHEMIYVDKAGFNGAKKPAYVRKTGHNHHARPERSQHPGLCCYIQQWSSATTGMLTPFQLASYIEQHRNIHVCFIWLTVSFSLTVMDHQLAAISLFSQFTDPRSSITKEIHNNCLMCLFAVFSDSRVFSNSPASHSSTAHASHACKSGRIHSARPQRKNRDNLLEQRFS